MLSESTKYKVQSDECKVKNEQAIAVLPILHFELCTPHFALTCGFASLPTSHSPAAPQRPGFCVTMGHHV